MKNNEDGGNRVKKEKARHLNLKNEVSFLNFL